VGVSVRVSDRAVARSLRIRRWGGPLDAQFAVVAFLVTLAAGLAAVLVFGDASQRAAALAVAAMSPAAVIDIRERRLPDRWVAFAAGVLAATTWAAWVFGQFVSISAMFLGAAVMAGPILVLHLVSPRSMGFGDVKAAVVLGAAVGAADWQLALAGLTLAAGLGVAIGIAGRARTIPFGPFLVLGSAIALAVSPFISMGAAP
jgi:leader peptidase (prepilin peptidase)/N-methyltransferase